MKRYHSNKSSVFLKGTASSAGAQIFSISVGLISVPIGIDYFGTLQYGLWVVISSVISYLGLSQFGLGTASAVLIAKNVERQNQGVIFRRSFRLLCYFALITFAFFFVAAMFPQGWAGLFGDIPDATRLDAISATLVIVLFYLVRLPTLAFTSALFGLQEIYLERFYANVLPTLLSFLALLLTVNLAGGLFMLAFLTGGAQLLAGLFSGLHFFLRHRDMFGGKMDNASDFKVAEGLLSSGGRFFIISMAAMVVWSTDSLIISYFLGPESVTAYSVTFKLFAAAFAILGVANTALIPMFGNAVGKNEWGWLNQIYEIAWSILAVFGGLVWVGGVLFAKPIISIWTGLSGYGGGLVVFALGGYGYILSTVNFQANFLSGMNSTRSMLWIGIAEAIANFVFSVIFVRWWGIGGVALGTFLSALLTVYWLLPKDISRQTQSRVKVSWNPIMKHFCLAVLPGIVVAYLIGGFMHGLGIWVAGFALCVIYLFTSWCLLSQQAQALLMRIVRANSRLDSEEIN